jgi:hypothetical protein
MATFTFCMKNQFVTWLISCRSPTWIFDKLLLLALISKTIKTLFAIQILLYKIECLLWHIQHFYISFILENLK